MKRNHSVALVGAQAGAFESAQGYAYGRLRVWVQWVTPELAAQWLGAAGPNRNLRVRRVEAIERDLTAKKYVFTGVPIIFDEKGKLIDGQHRLNACVAAGLGFFSFVVTGVRGEKAMDALDDVGARTHGDRLRIQLAADSANSASAVALLLWQFSRANKSAAWARGTYAEVKAAYVKNRVEIDWSARAIGPRIDPGVSSGGAPVLAAFAYARPINPPLIDQAALMYKSGDIPSDDHPMRRLRQFVTVGDRTGIGNKKTSSQFSRHALALVTLAFLERLLMNSQKRGVPKPDIAVLERIAVMRANARKGQEAASVA